MDLYVRCFVCNIKTDEWRSGLNGLMSQHSNTLITVLIRTILGDFNSARNIDDDSNSICPDCLSRIEDCEWQRITAQHCERELYELLVRTETQCSTQSPEIPVPNRTVDESMECVAPLPAIESAKSFPNNASAISNQSTSENVVNVSANETDRFHAEIGGDEMDEEDLEDVDYEDDGDDMDEFDEEGLEDDNDPAYKTEHPSDDDEPEYDEDDEDWQTEKVKRKRGRPPKNPPQAGASVKVKLKPGRPRKCPDLGPDMDGRRKCGRPSTKKSYDCQQCEEVFERYIDFQVPHF